MVTACCSWVLCEKLIRATLRPASIKLRSACRDELAGPDPTPLERILCERAALCWLARFIEERLPPLAEVALAASALAELRHGQRNTGVETLKRLLRHG